MSAARRADPAVRRAQLIAAALETIAQKGVAATSVSDIVRAAGVAQGTFYLHFSSKDELLDAVIASTADGIMRSLEEAVARELGAVEKLLALRDVFMSTTEGPAAPELLEFAHDPANRAIHERMEARLIPSLMPAVLAIIEQGVAEGAFRVDDPRMAAWFVLGGLHGAEYAGTPASEMPAALVEVTDLALRALGHRSSLKE